MAIQGTGGGNADAASPGTAIAIRNAIAGTPGAGVGFNPTAAGINALYGSTPIQGLGPGGLNLGGGGGQSFNPIFLPSGPTSSVISALHAATQPRGAATTAVAGPTPTLQDILQALAGSPPPQVQAVPAGPAPTLSDFFNPAPYNQASAGVRAGLGTATTATDQAYQQAMQQALSAGRLASQQAAQNTANATTSSHNAQSAEDAAIRTALSGAAPGSLLANQLGAQQATLDANNQRGLQSAQFFQNLVNSNNANMQSDLAQGKAGALGQLNSEVQGELAKIGLAESNDQATAQRAFASALNAYRTNNQNAIDAAANTNAKNEASYASAARSALTSIIPLMSNLSSTPQQQALNALNGSLVGTPVGNAVTGAYFGGQNSSGVTIPKATNVTEALQRLQAIGKSAGLNNSQMAQAQGLITQLLGPNATSKQPISITDLAQMLGLNIGAQ